MPSQDLENRNKILERRWKIMLAIAIIFLITRPLALYVVNHLVHKAANEKFQNKYPLVDPARELIPQDNFIVNIQPLRDYLESLDTTKGTDEGDNITIYYEQLNSGANITVNRDLKLYVASMIKVPIAIAAVKKVEKGEWKWDDEFMVQQSDLDSDSGDLYKQLNRDNDLISLDKLLESMLVDSDNTAKNILVRNMSQADFDGFEQEVGLTGLFDEQGRASAKDFTRVYRTLYTSSYLERENSQKILELLSKATFKEFLSQGIPDNVIFAHKYGENAVYHIFADSGIVYNDGKPYMLTVMLQGKDSSPETLAWAKNLMKDISQHAFEADR